MRSVVASVKLLYHDNFMLSYCVGEQSQQKMAPNAGAEESNSSISFPQSSSSSLKVAMVK